MGYQVHLDPRSRKPSNYFWIDNRMSWTALSWFKSGKCCTRPGGIHGMKCISRLQVACSAPTQIWVTGTSLDTVTGSTTGWSRAWTGDEHDSSKQARRTREPTVTLGLLARLCLQQRSLTMAQIDGSRLSNWLRVCLVVNGGSGWRQQSWKVLAELIFWLHFIANFCRLWRLTAAGLGRELYRVVRRVDWTSYLGWRWLSMGGRWLKSYSHAVVALLQWGSF